MPLGTEVGLDPCNIVLDGDLAPPQKGTQHPHFSAHFALVRSPISATAELLLASHIDMGVAGNFCLGVQNILCIFTTP